MFKEDNVAANGHDGETPIEECAEHAEEAAERAARRFIHFYFLN